MYRYRICSTADFSLMAEFMRSHGHFHCPEDYWLELPKIWHQWQRKGGLCSAVFWEEVTGAMRRRLGYGMSVFVAADFADELALAAHPYVGQLLYREYLEGSDRYVLSRSQVADANANDGVDLIMLHNPLRYHNLEHPVAQELLPLGMAAWYNTHAGNFFKRVFWECYGDQHLQFQSTAGYERIPTSASETDKPANSQSELAPNLMLLRRPITTVNYSSDRLWLFQQRVPKFRLTRMQQNLLVFSLEGHTDNELAELLSLSQPTIKKYWRDIFTKFDRLIADSNQSEHGASSRARGKTKRLVVLDYVRQNPQELRPFVVAAQ